MSPRGRNADYRNSRRNPQRLDLTAPTRLLGPRKILREGKLAKAKSGRKLTGYVFNDLVLFTEAKEDANHSQSEAVYRYPIPLEECSVKQHPRDEAAFTLTHRGETLTVRAASARQAQEWTRVIEGARQKALKAMSERRVSLTGSPR